MWQRDEARPTRYGGISFRSGLEAAVAEELDRMGVEWAYEQPLGWTEKYLPDFTILLAPPELELPRWVEVKPPALLYAVRDHLAIPERFIEDEDHTLTARQMKAAGLAEIWKPKRLAELVGQPVLVVSKIKATRTLSIEMMPGDQIRLSRSHPCVNLRRVSAEAEKRRQQEQRDRAMAQRRAEWEQQRQARADAAIRWIRTTPSRPARYAGRCIVCLQVQPADHLRVANSEGNWLPFCLIHLELADAVLASRLDR